MSEVCFVDYKHNAVVGEPRVLRTALARVTTRNICRDWLRRCWRSLISP